MGRQNKLLNLESRSKALIIAFIVLLSVILGVALSKISTFGWMYFGMFFLALVCALATTVVYDLCTKKRTSEVLLMILGMTFFAGFIGMTIRSKKMSDEESSAKRIVQELDEYLNQNDSLPNKLQDLNSTNTFKGLRYTKDGQHYDLRYSVDGWHYCQYSSSDPEWYCGD